MSNVFRLFQSMTDDERVRALQLMNGTLKRREMTHEEFKAANDNFDGAELIFYVEALQPILDLWVRCGGDMILTKLSYDQDIQGTA